VCPECHGDGASGIPGGHFGHAFSSWKQTMSVLTVWREVTHIKEGDSVKRRQDRASAGGEGLLDRVIDATGAPLDGKRTD